MNTFKDHLNNLFLNLKVKITLGHPDNDQHIIGTVVGFDYVEIYPVGVETYILLTDVTTNSEWLQDVVKEGKFNRHYLRFDDEIEII